MEEPWKCFPCRSAAPPLARHTLHRPRTHPLSGDHDMPYRSSPPLITTELQHLSLQRGHYSRGYRANRDDGWSSTGSISSHGSVDSVLIERFSGSDSNSGPSERRPESSLSDLEQLEIPKSRLGWASRLAETAMKGLTKRRAKRLLVHLITGYRMTDGPIARQKRCKAADGLLKIVYDGNDGQQIVAQRLVKTSLRRQQATRALLKLSDDELDTIGHRAFAYPTPETASMTLLNLVMECTMDALFFKNIISPKLKNRRQGALIILYLATRHTTSFFHNVEPSLIFDFSKRVIDSEEVLHPRWYCGVRLLFTLFDNALLSFWKYTTLLQFLLSTIFQGVIKQGQAIPPLNTLTPSQQDSAFCEPRLLPLVAECCEQIQDNPAVFPPPNTLNPFLELLTSLVSKEKAGPRLLDTCRYWASRSLIMLLGFPSIVASISDKMLSILGAFFVDMALYSWTLNIQDFDSREKDKRKLFISNREMWSVRTLCCLPESIFHNALLSALDTGISELDSCVTNPYEPLKLVERLLWLSNTTPPFDDSNQIHRALVKGGACRFLTYVLSHTGPLAPEDRGLWRAKGLAMTCLGNIAERMDEEQCRNYITKEMIDTVVAIKEDDRVPLVQKGQAIFTLQRYTLTADRCGIQPYYREDTSKMDDEFWSAEARDPRSPEGPISTRV